MIFFYSLNLFSQSKIQFIDTKKNFGFVKKGALVKIEFPFLNKGNKPILIKDVIVECSCTTVEFPKQPVLPNTKAIITVEFDTKSVYDRQDRTIIVISNAKNSQQKLRFKGVVLK